MYYLLVPGGSIERLCVAASAVGAGAPCPVGGGGGAPDCSERAAMVRAARGLLASVTRVLLLADIVVVKQLLLAKDKVRICPKFYTVIPDTNRSLKTYPALPTANYFVCLLITWLLTTIFTKLFSNNIA